MVKCEMCIIEMTGTENISCTKKWVKINGVYYHRNIFCFDKNDRCHDCGIINEIGNVHHYGCDMEVCPCCGGQLYCCDCKKEFFY